MPNQVESFEPSLVKHVEASAAQIGEKQVSGAAAQIFCGNREDARNDWKEISKSGSGQLDCLPKMHIDGAEKKIEKSNNDGLCKEGANKLGGKGSDSVVRIDRELNGAGGGHGGGHKDFSALAKNIGGMIEGEAKLIQGEAKTKY